MGNGISLEENENGNEECSRENNIEMKITSSSNENGENGENSSSNSTIKRIKKTSSDVSKKRRSTFKNGNSNSNNNASAYKKTKSRRR